MSCGRFTKDASQSGYAATIVVAAVSLTVLAALLLMSDYSRDVTKSRSASLKGSASMVILSQVVTRLHNRETLLASAEQSPALKNCLRMLGCPSDRTAFRVVDSRSLLSSDSNNTAMNADSEGFMTGTSSQDYMFNDRAGYCAGKGPNGSGDCAWAAVATFSASGDELIFHVTVFPNPDPKTSKFRSIGGRGKGISTDPEVPSDIDTGSRELLNSLAPRFRLSSFWANTTTKNSTKCYPGDAVVPKGMTEFTSPVCGTFSLSGATGTNCQFGQVVKRVFANGSVSCGAP